MGNRGRNRVLATCRLCRLDRELRVSHFMPAALYPKNKKKAMATRGLTLLEPEEIAARVLCDECEKRFNENGENEVLRWMAPKAKKGKSPLHVALRAATPVWTEPDHTCHWGSSLGISPEKFAYFGLSLVWRAAACEWPLPGGGHITPVDLGEFVEPIRLYLTGHAPFPDHTFVMLTVCTDDRSQEYWAPPQRSPELDGLVIAPIIGVLFRFWFGRVVPFPIHKTVFYPADGNPIFSTNCWDDALSLTFSELFAT